MKKIVFVVLAALLLLLMTPLVAADVFIIWEWDTTDDDVMFFRYQLDDQSDENWTVVDWSERYFTYGPVDENEQHILYVQQSYDKENWGESAYLSSVDAETWEEESYDDEDISFSFFDDEQFLGDAAFVEPDTHSETQESEEQQLGSIENEVAPFVKRIVLMAGAGVKLDNKVGTSLFNPEDTYIRLRTRILPSITVEYINSNVLTLKNSLSLGYVMGVGAHLYQGASSSNFLWGTEARALALGSFLIGERSALEAGAGVSFMLAPPHIHKDSSIDSLGIFFGPMLRLGFRYNITLVWSIEAAAEMQVLFSDAFVPYELSTMVRLGAGYAF